MQIKIPIDAILQVFLEKWFGMALIKMNTKEETSEKLNTEPFLKIVK